MTTDAQGNEIGKLFVGGLHQNTTNDDLRNYFSTFGEVEDAIVMIDHNTQRSRGFGYVKFTDTLSVEKVISGGPHKLNDKEIDPKQCNVNMKGKNRRSLKIFVGGIAPEVTENDVKNFFSEYGTVTDVNLMVDSVKQRHRGFAFVGFDDESVVKRLIAHHHVTLAGKQVEIKAMEPPNTRRVGLPTQISNGGLLPTHPFLNSSGFAMVGGGGRGGSHIRPGQGGFPGHQHVGPHTVDHRFMATHQQPDPHHLMAILSGSAAGISNVSQTGGPNPADYGSLGVASLAANLWGQQPMWPNEPQGHVSAYPGTQANSAATWGNSAVSNTGGPGSQPNPLWNDYYAAAAANFGMMSGGEYGMHNNQPTTVMNSVGGPHSQPVANGALHMGPSANTWGSWSNAASFPHGSVTSSSMGLHHNNPSSGHGSNQGASHQAFSYNANVSGTSIGATNEWSGPQNIAAFNR